MANTEHESVREELQITVAEACERLRGYAGGRFASVIDSPPVKAFELFRLKGMVGGDMSFPEGSQLFDLAAIAIQRWIESGSIEGVVNRLPKIIDDAFDISAPQITLISDYCTSQYLPHPVRDVFTANGKLEQYVTACLDGGDDAAGKIFEILAGPIPLLPRVREDIAQAYLRRIRADTGVHFPQPLDLGDGDRVYYYPTKIKHIFAGYVFQDPKNHEVNRTPFPG